MSSIPDYHRTTNNAWNPFRPVLNQREPDEKPWEAPSKETMKTRQDFRESVFRETPDHRRIHPHGGLGDTGRNILYVLHDRQCYGFHGLTRQRHILQGEAERKRNSPSTVFDSPVSTTATSLYTSASTERARSDNSLAHEGSSDGMNTKFDVDQKQHLERRVSYPRRLIQEVRTFAEYCSAVKSHSAFLKHLGGGDEIDEDGNRPQSSTAVSTISVAFSPDGKTMGSTHGDHTVKISCCHTGRLLQSLEGHPRTPWTVKYHPSDSRIVASGCLGYQVRIWNWKERACLQMVRLEFAIISISFHPTANILAIANGSRLHFWGIKEQAQTPLSSPAGTRTAQPIDRSSLLTEFDQRHMLRCVHFPPGGRSIIIGGVNTINEDPRRRNRGGIGGGGLSFYLRMWDFDPDVALQGSGALSVMAGIAIPKRAIGNVSIRNQVMGSNLEVRQLNLLLLFTFQPRLFVPRALLYNDGGFDVSPDGKTLCACAELWLPDGVDNAMELLQEEQRAYEVELGESERSRHELAASDPNGSQSTVPAAAVFEGLTTCNVPSIGTPSLAATSSGPRTPKLPRTPTRDSVSDTLPASQEYIPRTPENPREVPRNGGLSPPSPPGRRFTGVFHQPREIVSTSGQQPVSDIRSSIRGLATPSAPTPPAPGGPGSRPLHPLSVVSSDHDRNLKGRYVPHVVTVSLDTTPLPPSIQQQVRRGKSLGPVAKGYLPRMGQLLEACPLDGAKASAVTCVKFSPSADFCLIGYGVREPVVEGGCHFHPVTALYRIRGGMTHVSTMLSSDDDVNIARFHPDSGHGFVYGTKQGRVRVLSPRPWMFYTC